MDRNPCRTFCSVHCRTGSLEIMCDRSGYQQPVHCRTGSLESENPTVSTAEGVHCRTGSLKNLPQKTLFGIRRSLPHRQLRNQRHPCVPNSRVHCRTGSLEMAACNKTSLYKVHCRTGSLESTLCVFNIFILFTAAQAA